jgi:subtilisin family serine protease
VNTVFGSYIADWREDPANRDQNLTLRIGRGRVGHTWKIRMQARTVFGGIVHAWAGTGNPGTSRQMFPGSEESGYSLGMPGTEERSITVGSFVSRISFPVKGGEMRFPGLSVGQLSPFSSRGPSRYGALKPDIAAPGQYITAALSSGSLMATDDRYTPRHCPDGPYITIQGTSMATPFMAGVIALMLQRESKLTPEDIQQRLRVTAQRDTDTGRVWGSGFGFGKIDVPALLRFGQR